jgi:glycosyltransferase involved in cell wall biosynthesis
MSLPPTSTTCLIIPVLNGGASAARVASAALAHGHTVLVVDDGSTDRTLDALGGIPEVHVARHAGNLGKGAAIRTGLAWAREREFERAITIDGDGQHDPGDIPRIVSESRLHPEAIIIGARDMRGGNAPLRSRIGLSLGNAWLSILAAVRLPDSQSGFRSYPVTRVLDLGLVSTGFDLEFEVLVRARMAGIPIRSVPVSVRYPGWNGPGASHFRPVRDSLRIFAGGLRARIATPPREKAPLVPSGEA